MTNYETMQLAYANKLFGKPIPVADMSAGQLAKFKTDFRSYLETEQKRNPGIDEYQKSIEAFDRDTKSADAAIKDTQLGDKSQGYIDRLLDQSDNARTENLGYFDQTVAPQLDKLGGAADTAAAKNQEATGLLGEAGSAKRDVYNKAAEDTAASAGRYNNWSGDLFDQYAGTVGGLDSSDRDALQKYLGETDPLMTQIKAGGWGNDVTADPEGLGAQRSALGMALGDVQSGGADQADVMGRYKALTGPEATAQERYLAEMARRNFEGQDRGNREAVQQNLSQRGLNSGTLQIANNLAAQERLGQERTQAELGLQANAVGRSMQALAGYGGAANALRGSQQAGIGQLGQQAGQIRTANDAINTFNKEGSQVAQRFQDTTAQNEANRVGNLAGTRNTTARATNEGIGQRAGEVQSSGQNMLNTAYGREGDVVDAQTAAGNVGYDTNAAYAGAVNEGGQQGFQNQAGVTGATTAAAGTRAGTNNPDDENDALKIALGYNEGERAVGAARSV